jgi:hypothetical protein
VLMNEYHCAISRTPPLSLSLSLERKYASNVILRNLDKKKNVCKYVRKTREFAETVPGSHVTFVSNNAYE